MSDAAASVPCSIAFGTGLGGTLEPGQQNTIQVVVPDADQGTSYGMAALRYRGKPLLGFRATARHLSVFPFSAEVVAAVAGHLEGYDLSKGTIRFTADRPLPDDVVRDVVRHRVAEITG